MVNQLIVNSFEAPQSINAMIKWLKRLVLFVLINSWGHVDTFKIEFAEMVYLRNYVILHNNWQRGSCPNFGYLHLRCFRLINAQVVSDVLFCCWKPFFRHKRLCLAFFFKSDNTQVHT